MKAGCTAQLPNYSDLATWVETMGGRNRIAKKFGIDPSTLHRYIVGDQPTPKWITEFIELSEKNAKLKQINARYKRKYGDIEAPGRAAN